ncbi:hypothetical protein D6833_12615, partial [Candidatus Parcubacteria bacterium]
MIDGEESQTTFAFAVIIFYDMTGKEEGMTQGTELPTYKKDLFVGREKFLKSVMTALRQLSANQVPEHRTFAFRGERGTGKTWLLSHVSTLAREEKPEPAVFHLDLMAEKYVGHDPLLTVIAVLEALTNALGLYTEKEFQSLGAAPSRISRKVMEKLDGILSEKPLLVLVDHVYESEWDVLAPLEDYVLGPLASKGRVLLLLAGRGREYPWKTPELFSAKVFEMEPFTPEKTRQQVEKQVKRPKYDKEGVHALTGGYPMQNYFLAKYGFPKGLYKSVEEILRQVEDDERQAIQEYLEALCPLDTFDEEAIKWMLAAYYKDDTYKNWTHRQARTVREKLVGRYGFARWDEDRRAYVMYASARLSVRNALQAREIERWSRLYT